LTTELVPGTVLRDRYQVVSLIGQGGMGAVYLTEDTRLPGRRCAIKEIRLPPGLSGQAWRAQARAQFHREASTLARLDHPHLPKVSDFFSVSCPLPEGDLEAERDYLVMDFVPGTDLIQIVREARQKGRFLPEPQVLSWIEQLCDALSYLHRQDPPVIHRDIKPANVKLTPEGSVKLVDFGLVKPLDPGADSTFTGLRGLGSVPYTPLEQYGDLGDHTDVRSDLYALGATLYHLLTGNEPPSAQEVFLDPETLPLPRQLNPDISLTTEGAILAAMGPHPGDRPPTVEAWRRLLLSGIAPPQTALALARPPALTQRVSDVPPEPPSLWHQLWRENGWLMLLGVILTALVLYLTFR